MKFGFSLFGFGPRHYPAVAQAAEANGFESVWMSEHLVFPEVVPQQYPYTESGIPPVTADTPLYDPWIVLAAVAQATDRIRLGTNVYILPLRHPLITARTVVTLDRMSSGRVILGVGAGWLEDEFTVMGESFVDRGRRTDEIIGILRKLWDDDVITHAGDYLEFGPIKFQPKPHHGSVPIEVGGVSNSALRRAGALGDGWIEVGSTSLKQLASRLSIVAEARKDAGREHVPFDVTVIPRSAEWGRTAAGIRELEELGVTRVIVGPYFEDERALPMHDSARQWICHYAREVIAKVV